MSEPLKYIQIFNIEQANKRYLDGYKVHSVIVTPEQIGDQNPRSNISYIMSLSSEKAYDNITNLVDVTPSQVDEYLGNGYIVADSWSKVVRMVKKREPHSAEVQETEVE